MWRDFRACQKSPFVTNRKGLIFTYNFLRKCVREDDATPLTMPYLKVLLMVWLHKRLKLSFHKQPPWPRRICAENLRKLTWQRSQKFFYTFRAAILLKTCKQLCWMHYWFISKEQNNFHTVSGQSDCCDFYFDLVQSLYFLKWIRYFSTFLTVLTSLIYLWIMAGSMY